jgi:hypothetical protein
MAGILFHDGRLPEARAQAGRYQQEQSFSAGCSGVVVLPTFHGPCSGCMLNCMYLLYCDETNFQKLTGDFFVYGGIVIEATKAADLAAQLITIRDQYKVPANFLVKFNPGPEGMSHQDFVGLKQAYMAAAAKYDVKLLVNLLLHDIAKDSDEARRNGINTLCYHFDCFLNRPTVSGLVLIDRFNDKKLDGHLQEKLAVGLTGKLPFGDRIEIKHIVGYHTTAIGQSHFCSLVDIVLGSLRFAINAFTQSKKKYEASAASILEQLSPLFFREGSSNAHSISLWFLDQEQQSLLSR